MKTALIQAIQLILSGDAMLVHIIEVTLKMSLASSIVALILGVPLGVVLGMGNFVGRKALMILNRTLMGMPPVVCGLLCYMMFSGVGVLRHAALLYTVSGMVIAQVILITPIVAGSVENFIEGIRAPIHESAKGLRLSGAKTFILTINECRYQICTVYLIGFARAIAEVGAVSMVGGAIAYKTNVMTTAIMNYTNMGNFNLGVALGIILLLMSLALNLIVYFIQARMSR